MRTLLFGIAVVALSLLVIRAAWLMRDTPLGVKGERSATQQIAYTIEEAGTVLDLSGSGMTGVPMAVFRRTELRELDLSGNSLQGSLPAEIRHLTELRVLSLANNNFTGVPAEIGQLQELQVLDLSTNPITGLPIELGNLRSLQVLDLRGTDYSKDDLAIIRAGLPEDVTVYTDETPLEQDKGPAIDQ